MAEDSDEGFLCSVLAVWFGSLVARMFLKLFED